MASDIGSTVFTFGKYRNQTFDQVRAQDASYCKWVRGLPSPSNGVLKEFKQFLSGGPATASGPPRAPVGGQFQQPQRWQPRQSQTGSQPTVATVPAVRGEQQLQPQTSNSALIVELWNADEFRIFSPAYLDSLVWQAVTGLKLGKWDSEKRHWVFAAGQYDEVASKLHGHPALTNCSVELPPDWVLAKLDSFSRSRRSVSRIAAPRRTVTRATDGGNALDNIPAKTRDQLMSYQREGVQYGIAHGGRCLIGDEMGLGKTLQALGIVAHYCEDWPCLVVAPSSMRFVWRDQIVEWLEVKAEQVQVLTSAKETLNGKARFVVVSYNLVTKQERFQKRADGSPYMTIIVDESQFVKEHKSQRTKATVAICKSAKRALMLSGTAAVNRAAEMYTQLDALMPGEIPSFLCFVERYCEQVIMHLPGRKVVKWKGSRCTRELNLFLSNSVMIRRLKKDVLSQLPDKTRQRLVLDESQMDKTAIKKLEQIMQEIDEKEKHHVEAGEEGDNKDGDKVKSKAFENMTKLFRLTGEAKAGAVLEHVEMLLDGDVKFLCFAHHTFMLDKVEEQLQRKHVDYIRIDGSTKQEARPELVNRFQQQESVRVAVLSITACGQGLTLTAASHVVFAELYWVPGQLLQAEDRVHRVGQKSACLIQYLIAPKTMDERIFKMINEKACVVNGILNGEVKGMMETEPNASQQELDNAEAKTCAEVSQATQTRQQIAPAANDEESASATGSQQSSQMQVPQQRQQQQQQQQQQEEVDLKNPATDKVSPAVAAQSEQSNSAGVGTLSSDADDPCMAQTQDSRAEIAMDPVDQTKQTEPAKPTDPALLSGSDKPVRQIGQVDEEHQAGGAPCANQADGVSSQDGDKEDDLPLHVLIGQSDVVQHTQQTTSIQPSIDAVPGVKRRACEMEHPTEERHDESNSKDHGGEDQFVDCTQHSVSTWEPKIDKHLTADDEKQITNSPFTNKRKSDEHVLPAASAHRQRLPPASNVRAARIPGLRMASARTSLPVTAASPVKNVPCAPREPVLSHRRSDHMPGNLTGTALLAGSSHLGDPGVKKRRTLGQRLGAAGVGRAFGGS